LQMPLAVKAVNGIWFLRSRIFCALGLGYKNKNLG